MRRLFFFFIYTGPLSWPGGVSQCVTYFFSFLSVVNLCESDEPFWRFFSKCVWCLLAAAYPGDDPVNMFQLLRAKQLCDNRTLLIKALSRSDAIETVQKDDTLTAAQRKDMLKRCSKILAQVQASIE